jgi:hypothetical protein
MVFGRRSGRSGRSDPHYVPPSEYQFVHFLKFRISLWGGHMSDHCDHCDHCGGLAPFKRCAHAWS